MLFTVLARYSCLYHCRVGVEVLGVAVFVVISGLSTSVRPTTTCQENGKIFQVLHAAQSYVGGATKLYWSVGECIAVC